jgi:hypothetical protein
MRGVRDVRATLSLGYRITEGWGEGHGFRNEENQFEFHNRMGSFLQKHLSPQV